jgi:transcriptional regulator with XRE-family HTH domain
MQVERFNLGNYLRKVRESRGLSLRDLASLSREKEQNSGTPLTHSHISKIEAGEVSPNVRTLQKFAEALNLPMVIVLEGSHTELDTVVVVSSSDVSQGVVSALGHEALMQVLLLCQSLTEEQILSLFNFLRAMKTPSESLEDENPLQ